jgi:putative transposase
MSNHVHILLEPQERNLAEAMRSIFSRYAARFNRKYERRGHLFGGPYRQSICLDNTYLVTASVYIHLNPVRAGLCESPSDYRWTSSALYCSGGYQESFVDPKPILQLIDEDKVTARKEYTQLLKQAQGAEPDNALEQEGAIEKFCVRLAEKFPTLFGRLSGRGTKITADNPALLELTQLERLLKEASEDRSRKPESRQAKKYIVEQLLARGYKKTEIASRLGISRKTVYNILAQAQT